MNRSQLFDYIFCGGGASASLLLLSMHRRNALHGKSVLIIEKEHKVRQDKTFCFWSSRCDSIETDLKDVISQTWSEVILPNQQRSVLQSLRYHHVSSIDLYKQIEILEQHYGWKRHIAPARDVHQRDNFYEVSCDEVVFQGKLIFVSRTPTFDTSDSMGTLIHQSFIGWRVELQHQYRDTTAFRFMDFNVDQQSSTQFMYVLPFADGSALIELTRFGSSILQTAEAETILRQYIQLHFGDFIKIDEEKGCIPMCTHPILDIKPPGVVQLGSRNYAVKPSTGYAFKRMFDHAEEIAAHLTSENTPYINNRSHAESRKGRFPFYDSLLLDILERKPEKGKPIFEALFRHNSIETILTFLDERSKIKSEIAIFSSLPLLPFLSSLWRRFKRKSYFISVMLILFTTLIALIPHESPLIQSLSSSLFAIGLIAVGIPHGALDHLLETRSWNASKMPGFIIKYLSIALFMLMLWVFLPNVSLLIFLLYSAWHFGQADGKAWDMNSLLSFLWGSSVLIYILCTHVGETNHVIDTMSNLEVPFELPFWAILPWIFYFSIRKNVAGFCTVIWLFISHTIPLMYAFGIYFIGQHSITGWRHIKNHIGLSHKQLWLHALPFHIGAWLLLGSFAFLGSSIGLGETESAWGNFFIFLACLSLPHAMAMHRMYADGLR
jgi:lycopene beta-cyclase